MNTYFSYMGFKIPVDLLNMTGGGTDSFERISKEALNNSQFPPLPRRSFQNSAWNSHFLQHSAALWRKEPVRPASAHW